MGSKKIIRRCVGGFSLVMALCLFFAQTMMNLGTAKVRMVVPVRGYIEHAYDLEGVVESENIVPVVLYDARAYPVTIQEVYAKPGEWIEKGTLLFTTSLGRDYREELGKLDAELRQLRADNAQVVQAGVADKVNVNANRAMLAIQHVERSEAVFVLEMEIMARAQELNLTIALDKGQWLDAFPQDDPKISALYATWKEEYTHLQVENAELSKLYARVKERDFTYMLKQKLFDAAIAQKENQRSERMLAGNALSQVRMPVSGLLLEVDVKPLEKYEALNAAYSFSTSRNAVVAVNIGSIAQQKVLPQMACTVTIQGKAHPASVKEIERRSIQGETTPYAVIQITTDAASLPLSFDEIKDKVSVNFNFKSDPYDLVIPASAITSSGGTRVVYQIKPLEGYWGKQYQVHAIPVSILDYNETMAAIAGSVPHGEWFADKWDRPIVDGAYVMNGA